MLKEKPDLTKKIIKLTLPIVVQNLLSAAVSSADVIMLNYVGQSAISAVSLAAQYSSILFMVYYGLGTGATMLCAQYYGKKDLQAVRVIEGIALRFSLGLSTVFAVVVLLCPQLLMLVFTEDTELIALGATYLRVMSITYLCWGMTEVYLSILRSIGKVQISMVLNILAFSLNILLNAVFIFGLFGAPKLGVLGVAVATAASRVAELVGCMIVSLHAREVRLNPMYMFLRNRPLLRDFVKLSLPALANDVVWGTAFSMYSVILGHLGNDAVAANSLVTVVRNFGTTLCFGVASGSSILLGNLLGQDRMEDAELCAKKAVKLTVISGALGGLVILCATPFVLQFADLTDKAMYYLKYMLFINSYYVMGAAVNTVLIAGVFRAGGDSRFGFICDTIDMWVYAVPLGFLTAFILKLPVLWVYFLMCTDEFVKWPWVIRRYRSKRWLKNITRENITQEKERDACEVHREISS